MKSARVARMWHDTLSGHPVSLTGNPAKLPLTCTGMIRAGEGNRTLMTSLEGVQRTAVTAVDLVDPLPGSARG